MELRCRKRPKIENPTDKAAAALRLNDCSALTLTDDSATSNFCDGGNAFGGEKPATGFALLGLSRLKHSETLEDKIPNAVKLTSPKNPAKNGWLSYQNGFHSLPLSCSNGLTAPVVKLNGFISISNRHSLPDVANGQPGHHFDACCRTSGRRASYPKRPRLCDVVEVPRPDDVGADAKDGVAQLSSPSVSLEVPEPKALQSTDSLDAVVGSRSEQALSVARPELRSTNHCQLPQDFRKFNNLCKDRTASSSASSLSSAGAVGKKERATCQWHGCGVDVEFDALLEHITRTHVESQAKENGEESKFVCLWNGCKCYNRSSVLRTWLERHVLCHLGDKPYRCIVPMCRMRFASQFLLNRHINGHFTGLHSRPLRKGDPQGRQQKKKKLRNTRPCPVKTEDFFDTATMETIQNEIIRSTTQLTQVDLLHSGNNVTFQSYILAKRVDSRGHQEVLLRWWPNDLLADEWVPELQAASYATKVIPLSSLPSNVFDSPIMPIRPPRRFTNQHRKNRRK